MAAPAYRICLMHPMDPRGGKLGGIETHVRLILRRHPEDFSVLFVGVDELGDCKPGEVKRVDAGGRIIDFLPVAHIGADKINAAGKTIAGSTTFRFAVGALRYLFRIRAALRRGPATADLQRFEFAMLPKLLGLKTIQMVHGEGSKDEKMDSLIKSYWFIHRFNEKLALTLANRILCVNPNILKRLEREFPKAARKAEVMTVSVDTRQFRPSPFDCADGVFRILFAGRLDEFKDPPLMFRVLKALHARLGGKLEFHYAGTTDANRYAEFAAIDSFTTRHGFMSADGVAALAARCHAGVLTSYFEGMPCYLLETLASGRPFAAIRLPQYDPLIVEGVSGFMVERSEPVDACETALTDAFARLWEMVKGGAIDPARVHERALPYSVENQMARLFTHHRALQGGIT
jgi:glycosyltransferase involved in cell wall biosynthesis